MTEQITTPEALDALPAGSILRDNDGLAVWRDPHLGWCAGNMTRDIPADLFIADGAPLTVLHRPDAPAPSAEDREVLVTRAVAVADALDEADAGDHALDYHPGWMCSRNLHLPDPDGPEFTTDDLRALAWFAARQPAPVDAETAEVIAERARAVSLGYGEQHDDEQGADALALHARHYVARALAQGNRSDLIKAAGLLLNAAASFRRLGQPVGMRHERVADEHAAALAAEEDERRG